MIIGLSYLQNQYINSKTCLNFRQYVPLFLVAMAEDQVEKLFSILLKALSFEGLNPMKGKIT